MVRSRTFAFCLALIGVALLSGCRTYGDGKYGTSTKTYEALQQAVQSFEADLSEATSNYEQLQEAAAQADTLRELADQYHSALEQHKSFLKKQHDRLDRLSTESSYRNLHRAYGAAVTEQQMTEQDYQRIIRAVQTVVQEDTAASPRAPQNRQYTIRPINFPREDGPNRLTMKQALQGL